MLNQSDHAAIPAAGAADARLAQASAATSARARDAALIEEMLFVAREARDASADGVVTFDDLRRAGRSSIGVVPLPSVAGMQPAFAREDINRLGPKIIAALKEEARRGQPRSGRREALQNLAAVACLSILSGAGWLFASGYAARIVG